MVVLPEESMFHYSSLYSSKCDRKQPLNWMVTVDAETNSILYQSSSF